MNAPLAPASVNELIEMVRGTARLLAVGAGTKPRLTAVDRTTVTTSLLQGLVEYEPSEFTFTALAGTPIRQLADTLKTRGQYLPFDPVLAEAGATLGGTVAAGLSGPGRLRYGGIRDFVLGARFVDGLGRALRVGGKVVKNAAGFDLPKFFVGSLGRFGVLVELTFKVFPAPAATLTLRLAAGDIEAAGRILVEAARSRWEPEALELLPDTGQPCLRLAGPAPALEQIAQEILSRWPGEKLTEAQATVLWSDLREFRWTHRDGPLIKIALTPAALPALHRALKSLPGARLHVSAGGNMAFVSLSAAEQAPNLSEALRNLSLPALTIRGPGPLWPGTQRCSKIAQAVKQALDPHNRFPALEE